MTITETELSECNRSSRHYHPCPHIRDGCFADGVGVCHEYQIRLRVRGGLCVDN